MITVTLPSTVRVVEIEFKSKQWLGVYKNCIVGYVYNIIQSVYVRECVV